jgi:hypothetical protein
MKMALQWAFAFGLVLAVAGSVPAAVDPAFDFTGHWAGAAQEDSKPQQGLTADLVTQPGTRVFTGTMTVEDDPTFTCNVIGHQKRHHMKVKIRITCDNGATLGLHATLDAATETLTGGYRRRGRNKVHVGTFTLTRQPI